MCVCVCIRVSVHIPSINLVSRWRQVYSDQYPACVYTVVTLSSLAYFHHHRHYPTCTLIFTILPNSHLHNTTFTLIFTILPPPSSSQYYLTLIFTILPSPSSSLSYLHSYLPSSLPPYIHSRTSCPLLFPLPPFASILFAHS